MPALHLFNPAGAKATRSSGRQQHHHQCVRARVVAWSSQPSRCPPSSVVDPSGCGDAGAWQQSAAAVLSAVALLCCGPSPAALAAAAPAVIQGQARVVDGDTLVVNEQRIRMFGIDAPEKAQSCKTAAGGDYPCGQVSKEALTAKVGSQAVTCQVKNVDQYGRNVAQCSLGGREDLGSFMVSNGLAVAYRQYSSEYIPLEDAAKAAHRGVWQGPFQPPAEWRKAQKAGGGSSNGSAAASAQAPLGPGLSSIPLATNLQNPLSAPGRPAPGCNIKGNIGSGGQKIYHVPSGKYYDQVVIDEKNGERYFCSEGEAQAAGWRAAKS